MDRRGVIGGVIVVLSGIGGYSMFNRRDSEAEPNTGETRDEPTETESEPQTPATSPEISAVELETTELAIEIAESESVSEVVLVDDFRDEDVTAVPAEPRSYLPVLNETHGYPGSGLRLELRNSDGETMDTRGIELDPALWLDGGGQSGDELVFEFSNRGTGPVYVTGITLDGQFIKNPIDETYEDRVLVPVGEAVAVSHDPIYHPAEAPEYTDGPCEMNSVARLTVETSTYGSDADPTAGEEFRYGETVLNIRPSGEEIEGEDGVRCEEIPFGENWL